MVGTYKIRQSIDISKDNAYPPRPQQGRVEVKYVELKPRIGTEQKRFFKDNGLRFTAAQRGAIWSWKLRS